MMQICEAAMPEELKRMNVVAGKATIEKMLEERAGSEEKKRKIRLIDERIKRMWRAAWRITEFRRVSTVQVRGCVHEGSGMCGMGDND